MNEESTVRIKLMGMYEFDGDAMGEQFSNCDFWDYL